MTKFQFISKPLKNYFICVFGLMFFSPFIMAQTATLDVSGTDFSFLNSNRTTISGTPTTSGSVVKYANVLTKSGVTVYAKVTMTLDANVTISNYDDDTSKPGQFQPIISTTGSGIKGATYKMEFFDTATDFPIYLRNFILTGMDVDGNPAIGGNPAYTEVYRLSNQEYSAYRRSNATQLTTSTVGSFFQILGSPTSINGTNFDNSNSFLVDYNSSKTSITFFIGNSNAASGRLAAMKLGTAGGAFTVPTTTTPNPTTKATTDLQILKSVNSNVALANTNVIFTLAATNLGTAAATGVQVGDLLPSGYTFVSASAPSGTTYNNTTGVWTIGNLAVSASLNLQITATVKTTGNLTNVAIITGNEIDSNLTNNTASATVTLADPCTFGASTDGNPTPTDRDGDGVNDVCDLDDDNDGILDTVECGITCNDPFINGGFEFPDISNSTNVNQSTSGLGWQTTATDNLIELWNTGHNGVPSAEGSQFAELNATQASTLYQTFCLNGAGGTVNWSVKHRGRNGVDVAAVKFGSNLATAQASTAVQTMTDGNTSWGAYSGTYTIPAGQTTLVIAFQAISTSEGDPTFGNFIDDVQISINQACFDTDNDGIPNNLDLDSDGDGCPDVIEGGANFTSGASYITNNALNTTVNSSGVPAVPSATPTITGYDQTNGQTVNQAYTVNPAAVAGTASSNQTIVSGTSPLAITLTGSTGTIQWQSSIDNVTFANISGATSASYSPGTMTSTTYYRAVVSSLGGCSVNTNSVVITVVPNTDSDGDEVVDYYDLDDDNDGILDTDEGFCLSTPLLIESKTFSATGSGAAGRPNITFSAPTTGTGKRLMFLTLTIERDHTPTLYGDNWESTLPATDNFANAPVVKFGSNNMTASAYNTSFKSSPSISHSDATISVTQYVYTLWDSQISAGLNSIDLSNFQLPKNAGDEWHAEVLVFDHVNNLEYIGVQASSLATNSLSISGNMLANSQPAGTIEQNNVLLAFGATSAQSGMSINSGWNTITTNSVANTNGTYATDPNKSSDVLPENDGISVFTATKTGVTGNQTATFSLNKSMATAIMYRLIPFSCNLRDTDGDGIPDYLDLDSDDDGCADALEGDENVTAAQLTSNRISGTVDANGVPNLVNAGGAADVGSDVGQGIGSSQNSGIQDIQCLTGFGCTSSMYLSQGSNTSLYNVITTTNPFTYPAIGSASGINYNAIGLNPLNGFIYGVLANTNQLVRINSDGTYNNLGAITGLPNSVIYNAGEIDNLGNFYVKVNTSNNQLYKINLTTLTATTITLSASINVPDIAYRTTDGLIYGVNSTNGQLVSINPSTGTVTGIGITPGAVNFGAMFGSSTGEIFGVNNNGGFYQFNLTNGQRVLISGAPASSANDGAHCVTAPITFSADLYITKTDGKTIYSSGGSTTYTVVAGNNGPFGVLNATVSDLVPSGIPAANMSYTAAVAGGATTSVVGTQTGAINDLVSIPVGGTITYTITVNIPSNFSGNLVNTASITPPANTTDTNNANNSATDTDLGTCYKPAQTSGTTLDTNHGITALGRAGADNSNWPMVRKGAWTVLEAKTKGFVVNRLTDAQVSAIPNADLREGMMVYNITQDCLQINIDGTANGWRCFNTQTCPD